MGARPVSIDDQGVAVGWVAVVPSDTAFLANRPRAIWVGVGGDISLTDDDGTSAVFKNVPSGHMLCCAPVRVNAAGTTATSIVALY